MYDEVTASSLVKIDMQSGGVIDEGTTTFGVSSAAVALHAAAYSANAGIACVIHIAAPAVLSV